MKKRRPARLDYDSDRSWIGRTRYSREARPLPRLHPVVTTIMGLSTVKRQSLQLADHRSRTITDGAPNRGGTRLAFLGLLLYDG